jgi:hypothetical protein
MNDPPLSPHPLSYAQSPARQSPAGIISFVCGIISILSLCLSLTAVKRPPASLSVVTRLIGLLIFAAFVAVPVLGLVTGILGVLPPRRKRALAIAGLILNGFVFLVILLLTIAAWLVPH